MVTLSSLNPANGTLLRSYDTLSIENAMAKVAEAQQAFLKYRETPLGYRVLWMKKVAGIMEQEMEELATLLTKEMGKTITDARNEILNCAAYCRFYAENAGPMLEDETVRIDVSECVTTWQPMGVLLAVTPCSSPFWQVVQFAVPALLGGNAVVVKHSSRLPQCAMEMELLFRRAGFSSGVFQTLLLSHSDLETVLNDDRIAGVAIAGMKQTTREIAAQSAWMGKKTVTQQRRSNAMIVMPSANLFAAIQAGVAGRCVDNGQSSASTARFLVHQDIYDDFAILFAAAMEDVKIGNPLKDETELGPLATEQGVSRLQAQVASAVAAGGLVVTGGEVMLGDGNYFEPTVIVDVPMHAAVSHESIDGPVALLFKVDSLKTAIGALNATQGLNVSVWTQEQDEQQQVWRELTGGNMFLNASSMADARGGSVFGKAMALTNLRDFVSARTMVKADLAPGPDFNFELALDEFDQENGVAGTAQPEVMSATALDKIADLPNESEMDFQASLFVASQNASMQTSDSAVAVMEPVTVQTVAPVADEPGDRGATSLMEAAKPAVIHQPGATLLETPAAPAVPSLKEMFERALQARV